MNNQPDINQNQESNVLVTGADGMLGSNLVRGLLDKNYSVSVLLHPNSNSRTLEGLNIKRYFGDILHSDSIENIICRNDYVVHAAANTNVWPARSKTIRDVNIQGIQNIIYVCIKKQVKKLIFIGSVSLLNSGNELKDEFEIQNNRYGLDYIDSKYYVLKKVFEAVEKYKLPAIAILPTYMIGPYDSLPSSGKMILALARGKLRFYTGGGRNFIYVGDVVSAIINSLDRSEPGRIYVAGNENLTFKSFFDKVAKIVGKPGPKIQIPCPIVKYIGYLGSIFGKLTNKEPLLSYEVALNSCEKKFIANANAKELLNMPQTSIELAITDSYNWFRNNGYCK